MTYVKWKNRNQQDEAKAPVKDVFTKIYEENKWGGASGEYFSGTGSMDPSVPKYAALIRELITEKQISTVVDLGCGDFKVGCQIQIPGVKYIGIDIVQSLVEYNRARFSTATVSFLCCDIIKNNLPEGQLCLIRQVLQHLSNQEIASILHNTQKYQYVIITEHYPSPIRHVIPNKDKPHGTGIRVLYDSAVYLDLPPFNLKVSRVLLDVDIRDHLIFKGERLTTFLIENK
jgi:hypothetical protein